MPAPKDPIKYQEYIDKISKAHKGRKQSQQQILNRVNSRKMKGNYSSKMKGMKRPKRSQEWCNNLSIGLKGTIPWNKNRKTGPLSLEHRKSIGKSNSKPKPPFTEEHKQNIKKARAFQVMKKHSSQTIEKIKQKRALQIMPMRDSKPERIIQIGLLLHQVKFEKHKSIIDNNGFYHQVDIFIEPNICIEIDGDYWHANPEKYCSDFIIKTRSNIIITSKDIWIRDILVNNKLKSLGYKILRIWESDIKANPQKEVMGILQLIKKECF